MTTSFARKPLLGAAIAASMGIGYAIGAQPHMSQTIACCSRRAPNLPRRRRTRAAIANARWA